ncbi:MAG: flagellar export protein FliJ [Methylocystis sp.]|nr:flagellar export protein FliJ [Methylocystis sp.]
MKSRDTLLRLKRFQADEMRRRVVQLNTMISEFTRMSNELDREIAQEEQRANINDPNHFAYPTYARAARTRRDNIVASLAELRGKLEAAEAEMKEANEELSKAHSAEARDRGPNSILDVTPIRPAEVGEALRRA